MTIKAQKQADKALIHAPPFVSPGVWTTLLSSAQVASNWLLDLVFPPTCGGCGRADTRFCADCRMELTATPLQVTSKRLADDSGVIATGKHGGMLRKAVQALKYDGVLELDETLAERQRQALLGAEWQIDTIVPVPLHANRLEKRGYNQSELLSRILARDLHVACQPQLLQRLRDTKQQSRLQHGERKQNVEGAFAAVGDLRGLRILLVDDVVTTGWTMSQCALALRANGAAAVYGIAVTGS